MKSECVNGLDMVRDPTLFIALQDQWIENDLTSSTATQDAFGGYDTLSLVVTDISMFTKPRALLRSCPRECRNLRV